MDRTGSGALPRRAASSWSGDSAHRFPAHRRPRPQHRRAGRTQPGLEAGGGAARLAEPDASLLDSYEVGTQTGGADECRPEPRSNALKLIEVPQALGTLRTSHGRVTCASAWKRPSADAAGRERVSRRRSRTAGGTLRHARPAARLQLRGRRTGAGRRGSIRPEPARCASSRRRAARAHRLPHAWVE